ncbi:MAG TPA: hypothetical protein DCR71_02530 [Dehalococcoidia bacterium]|jgi:uncharacterized membrane protein|nr:hypothetical protein [Dehalococcoidia bacterium]HAS28445.1 hypothetical protein [Dehalococcoidia bacterium]
MGNTATGLQENIAALLCYVLGWVTGLIFFLLEPNNRFIKFHAMQSIIVFGAITLLGIVLDWIPVIDVFMVPIISILAFILWVILIVKAYQWVYFKLPLVGDLAEKWANK